MCNPFQSLDGDEKSPAHGTQMNTPENTHVMVYTERERERAKGACERNRRRKRAEKINIKKKNVRRENDKS